MRSYRSCQG